LFQSLPQFIDLSLLIGQHLLQLLDFRRWIGCGKRRVEAAEAHGQHGYAWPAFDGHQFYPFAPESLRGSFHRKLRI
jgi:hypothetical protein